MIRRRERFANPDNLRPMPLPLTKIRFLCQSLWVALCLLAFGCSSSPSEQNQTTDDDSFWPDFSLPSIGIPKVHRIVIQQGNVITQEMVDRLKPGMTRAQVQYVMGRPVLDDLFNANRWVYIYTVAIPDAPNEQRTVTLEFENELLARLSGDLKPQGGPSAEQSTKESTAASAYQPTDQSLTKQASETATDNPSPDENAAESVEAATAPDAIAAEELPPS